MTWWEWALYWWLALNVAVVLWKIRFAKVRRDNERGK